MALAVTKRAESRNDIKTGWGKRAPEIGSKCLEARANLLHEFKPKKSNSLIYHYKKLLQEIKELKNKFYLLESSSKDWQGTGTLEESLEKYSRKDSYTQSELADIIPIFFIIQYHAWVLDYYLREIIPITSITARKKRASEGGEASTEGRELLIKLLTNLLKQIPNNQTYESFSNLQGKKGKEIKEALENYEKEKNSLSLPYPTPKFHNVPDRLKDWANTHPDLKAELTRVVPSGKW